MLLAARARVRGWRHGVEQLARCYACGVACRTRECGAQLGTSPGRKAMGRGGAAHNLGACPGAWRCGARAHVRSHCRAHIPARGGGGARPLDWSTARRENGGAPASRSRGAPRRVVVGKLRPDVVRVGSAMGRDSSGHGYGAVEEVWHGQAPATTMARASSNHGHTRHGVPSSRGRGRAPSTAMARWRGRRCHLTLTSRGAGAHQVLDVMRIRYKRECFYTDE